MSAVSLGAPILVAAALLLLPFGWWMLIRSGRRQQNDMQRFGEESLLERSSQLPSPRSQFFSLALRFGAVAFGLIALARPQWGERPSSRAQTGRDVLVVLDLSRSMNAQDGGSGVPPQSLSRLAAAKQAISEVLSTSSENRVGLIVFGGGAFLQLPLTTNQAAFRRFLDAASTDDLGDPATNLAGGLSAAAVAFEHDGERGYQTVLLVSDGESGSDMEPALTRLRRARVPVFALGIGTAEGAPIPADSSEAPERWHRDHIGRIVVSRLEEGDLQRAARETGGGYARWSPGTGRAVGMEVSRLAKRRLSADESAERADRYQWPLGFALLAAMLQPMLAARRRTRP